MTTIISAILATVLSLGAVFFAGRRAGSSAEAIERMRERGEVRESMQSSYQAQSDARAEAHKAASDARVGVGGMGPDRVQQVLLDEWGRD